MSGGATSGELAGRLRELVTIQRRGPERDALAGAEGEWAAIGDVWAALEPSGTGDPQAGDAWSAMPRWRATVRSGADVMVGDRIVWRGRMIVVRHYAADPAKPDRIMLIAEEMR
jgi:head-tail adaptor